MQSIYHLFLPNKAVTECTPPYRPSAVMRMRATSAGVPTKAPVAPAVMPISAFIRKLGGVPSGLVMRSNSTV